MSGICGIVRLDGGKPLPAEINGMTQVLQRRGPDGTRTWLAESAALGHTLLATTPEALVERLPLTHSESGCTITADVRLDNREELLAALDLVGESRVIGDGELILLAYLRWGEECPKHLLGDFAFAIWDPRTQRLFAARDHMGMRQFNYCHMPGQVFAFSTEDTGVLAHEAVPKALNEGRIADFIGQYADVDITSTTFESVYRLPPAHSLAVDTSGCKLRRYWTLEPGPLIQLETDAAYAEAFLQVFTEAIQARLRSSGSVGAMLSGGLDSSAVTAVAANLLSASGQGPLHTISAVSPDAAQCAETQAIHSALTIDGLRPILVSLDDLGGITAELVAALKETRDPFEANCTILRCIYASARREGLKVVLDGGSGDVILTPDNRAAALLRAGKLKLALREITGEAAFWQLDRPFKFIAGKLLSGIWVAFAPLTLRSRWRRLRISKRLPAGAPGIAKRVRFAERRQQAAGHLRVLAPSDPAWRTQVVLHPHLVSGRERYDQVAGSLGVECRDPFMDLRVIAFCLSIPVEQLQTGGWPKVILRRAIEKFVPASIAWRRGKEHLGWEFTTALLARCPEWQESMCDPQSPLTDYVSASVLFELRDSRDQPPTGPKVAFMALDRLLRRYGGQPTLSNGSKH